MKKYLSDNQEQWVSQAEVIRYIMGNLMPLCTDDPLPFRERETARLLNANRVTVHKAAMALYEENALIRIPGKRGLFLNPEHGERGKGVKYYGIVSGRGEIPVINEFQNRILKGFFDNISSFHYVDMEQLYFKATGKTQIVAEILHHPLVGLIWFSPTEDMYQVIEELLKKRFPVVVINTGILPEEKIFHTNTLHLDFGDMGKAFAEKVLSLGFEKILFAGCRNGILKTFREHLAKNGFAFSDRDFMEYVRENPHPEKLMERIRKEKIQLMVSDGTVFHDLEILKKYGDISRVHFLFRPMSHVRRHLKSHQEYLVHYPDYLCDETLEKMGRTAAEKIAEDQHNKYFENISFQLVKSAIR